MGQVNVHDTDLCAWYSLVCLIQVSIHKTDLCAWYSLLYMIQISVHTMQVNMIHISVHGTV